MSYFGGSSLRKTATIRRLDAENWTEFVERYFHIPVTFNMTREDYHKLPVSRQDELKDGPFFSAAVYAEDTTDRKPTSQPTGIAMIVLDIDKGAYMLPFIEAPDTLAEALHPHNFVSFLTAKHTPENPRMKVVVEVVECDTELLRQGVLHCSHLLGLPPESLDACSNSKKQNHYRPMQFLGETGGAVLCSRTSGEPLDIAATPTVKEKEDKRTYAWQGDTEDCDLTHLPVLGMTVEDIRAPLFKIDPDCGYAEWTRIAAGLRHQFTEEDDAREAYTLFDEWSASGTKYRGEKETHLKWRSFRPYATNGSPVTVRSLLKYAVSAGWVSAKLSSKTFKSLADWIKKQVDPETLLDEGCSRIAGLPLPSKINEESLITKLQIRYKDLSGEGVSKTAIQKQIEVERLGKRNKKLNGSMPAWLRPMCFVTTENMFRNMSNGEIISPDAFNNAFSSNLMPSGDDDELGKTGRPMMLPTHYALNVAKVPKVGGVIYDPRENGANPVFPDGGRVFLNLYRRETIPVLDSSWSDRAGELFTNHIATLIRETAYQKLLIDFLCHIVQKPGIKIPWMPFVQSGQGAGKGVIIGCMKGVLGEDNVKEVTAEALQSQWNDWMVGSVMNVLNEIHVPGNNRESVMNALKQPITDPWLTVNKRNTSVSVVPNLTNFIGFTNFHHVLSLSESDRRYMPIESPYQTAIQISALERSGHFIPLFDMIKNHAGALRHWMLKHKISKDFPVHGPAPVTTYRKAAIDASKNRLQVRIERIIEDPAQTLIGEEVIHYSRLESLTVSECRNNHGLRHFLPILGYVAWDDGKEHDIHGERTEIWVHRTRYDVDFETPIELLNAKWQKEKDL